MIAADFQRPPFGGLVVVVRKLRFLGRVFFHIPIYSMDVPDNLAFSPRQLVVNSLPAASQLLCDLGYRELCFAQCFQLVPFLPAHVVLLFRHCSALRSGLKQCLVS